MTDFLVNANGFAPLILLSPLLLAMAFALYCLVKLDSRVKTQVDQEEVAARNFHFSALRRLANADDDLYVPVTPSIRPTMTGKYRRRRAAMKAARSGPEMEAAQ